MFKLPDLPYSYEALTPFVSSKTMHLHHDKHQKAYVDATNALVAEKGLGSMALEDLVRYAAEAGDKEQPLFNQSAQAWNHGFFWECMATPQGQKPQGNLAALIDASFGSLQALRDKFVSQGVGQFGSGWVWLVHRDGDLQVITTHDGGTALVSNSTPILVCDVWEHAYYLDYLNVRRDFLEKWFDNVANWAFAASQFEAAKLGTSGYQFPKPE
jgi:superoxide dismutase, Fe-Mn family